MKPPRPYWNPYVAGVGLGLVLLGAFVLVGHGIGVSGAAASVVAATADAVAPAHARANPYLAAYVGDGTRSPLHYWARASSSPRSSISPTWRCSR